DAARVPGRVRFFREPAYLTRVASHLRNSGMSASPPPPAAASAVETDVSRPSPGGKSADRDERPARESSEEVRQVRTLAGFNGNRRVPPPVNEPVKSYAPGSPER